MSGKSYWVWWPSRWTRIKAFLFCRREHYWVGTSLPEEEFGLYAFSHMECRRCGTVDPYFKEPPSRTVLSVTNDPVTRA